MPLYIDKLWTFNSLYIDKFQMFNPLKLQILKNKYLNHPKYQSKNFLLPTDFSFFKS